MDKQSIIKQFAPLGEPKDNRPWADYSIYGLTAADAPTLARLAADGRLYESEDDDAWVPLHAWRALRHLMPAGLQDLLVTLNKVAENDWAMEEIPVVIAAAGKVAFDPLLAYIMTSSNHLFARMSAVMALKEIGKKDSALRKLAIGHLVDCLQTLPVEEQELNGMVVAELLDLNAVEAVEAIRAAYASGRVDWSICGDMEDVELSLGLRTQRDTPRPNYLTKVDDDEDEFEFGGFDEGFPQIEQVIRTEPKIGRNDPCPCGSGKKYKKCCMP